jgi:hypothetical protein
MIIGILKCSRNYITEQFYLRSDMYDFILEALTSHIPWVVVWTAVVCCLHIFILFFICAISKLNSSTDYKFSVVYAPVRFCFLSTSSTIC